MRKALFDLSLRAAAVVVLSGGAIAFMLAAAGPAPAADLGATVVYGNGGHKVCGQVVDNIVLFDERDRPTLPARTPMYTCITGATLVPSDVPPPPEYCCH